MSSSSKADYLKKYLSGPKGSSAAKKKKKPEGGNTIIIDEGEQNHSITALSSNGCPDVDWRSQQPAKKSSLYGKAAAQRKSAPVTIDDAGSDEEGELQRAFQVKVNHADGSGWAAVEEVGDRDQSPPRKGRRSPASPRVKTEPMSDLSPPRRVKIEAEASGSSEMRDLSPPRRVKTEPESASISSEMRDLSPPRRGREAERDLSPPRRGAAGSSAMADLSPPRRNSAASATASDAKDRDLSPPRRGANKDTDLSPPRRGGAGRDLSPPRRPAAAASKDLSPPRRGRSKSKSKSKDASPARRARHDSPDQSPPRSRQRHDSPDASSSSNGRSAAAASSSKGGAKGKRSRSKSGGRSGSESPPRKRKRHDSESPEPRDKRDKDSKSESSSSSSSARAGTGLQNAAQFTARAKEEAERKQAALKALPADVSGVNSKTIMRDRHGRKLSAYEIMQKQAGGNYQNEDEKGMVWGKGLVQNKDAAEKAEDLAAEREGSFARSRNDSKLDELQRGRERWGDPMLEALKKKEKKRQEMAAAANASAVVGTPRPRPVFQGQSWTNRFALKSGYRWDGVDRSNGWENKMFKYNAEKGARNLEAHRWSVSDM